MPNGSDRFRFEGVKYAPTKYRSYNWVDTVKGAKRVVDELWVNKRPTALDSEFWSRGPRRNVIQVWSASVGKGSRHVLHGELLHEPIVREWLQDPKNRFVWWNYKADGFVFKDHADLDMDLNFWADMLVMDWLDDETDPKHGLKHSGNKRLGWTRGEYGQLFSYTPNGKKKQVVVEPYHLLIGELPDEMLAIMSAKRWRDLFFHYAADDAEETALLYWELKAKLKQINYWEMYRKLDGPYTITLKRKQARGMPVNMDKLDDKIHQVNVELLRAETAFKQAADVAPDFNIRSTQQLSQLLFEELEWPTFKDLRTPNGAPKLDKVARRRYIDDHGFELARYLDTFKKFDTKRGTFLEGMRKGVLLGHGADEGILYTDFNQIGAKSGRISSRKFDALVHFWKTYKTKPPVLVEKSVEAGMNIQNIPNPYMDVLDIREVFEAPPGWVFLVGDYSAFELWMALYNCHRMGIKSKMLKHLLNGDDVHSMTAVAVCELDCHWNEVKKKYPDRRNNEGKRCNFNLLYGGAARMLAAIMGWDTRDERIVKKAQRMIDTWNGLWPEMSEYQRQIVAFAYEHGWVPTIAGRRVRVRKGLDFVSYNPDPEEADREQYRMRRHYENLAKNGPCQGSAADIVRDAQNRIERDEDLRKMGYMQVSQVHDEIVGLVPEQHAEEAKARKEEIMKQPFADVLPFPLVVDLGIGQTWLEAK